MHAPLFAARRGVDLHLHPAWQQRVVHALKQAFPKMQFIVSSHSPQVLSTVKSETIRMLFRDMDGRWQAKAPNQQILGLESAIALNDVMGVNPIPPVKEAELIADYTTAIERGLHDTLESRELRQQLQAIYGEGHFVLIDADRLIRFQNFKLRQAGKKEG